MKKFDVELLLDRKLSYPIEDQVTDNIKIIQYQHDNRLHSAIVTVDAEWHDLNTYIHTIYLVVPRYLGSMTSNTILILIPFLSFIFAVTLIFIPFEAEAICLTSGNSTFCYTPLPYMITNLSLMEISTPSTGTVGGGTILDLTIPLDSFTKDLFYSDFLIGISDNKEVIMVSTFCPIMECVLDLDKALAKGVDSLSTDSNMTGGILYTNVVHGKAFRVVLEGENAMIQVKPTGKSTEEDFKKIALLEAGTVLSDPNQPIPTTKAKDIRSTEPRPAVPEWIKNNAKWWSEGLITEEEFVSGIEWLINNGIIRIVSIGIGEEGVQ